MSRIHGKVIKLLPTIKRMLAEGFKGREIARQLGVSRGTVVAINTGVWEEEYRRQLAEAEARGDDPYPHMPVKPYDESRGPVWCEKCRASVYPPCILCQLRELNTKKLKEKARVD